MIHLKLLVQDESGATAIEYALIGTLIAIAIFASLNTFAASLSDVWMYVAVNVDPAM